MGTEWERGVGTMKFGARITQPRPHVAAPPEPAGAAAQEGPAAAPDARVSPEKPAHALRRPSWLPGSWAILAAPENSAVLSLSVRLLIGPGWPRPWALLCVAEPEGGGPVVPFVLGQRAAVVLDGALAAGVAGFGGGEVLAMVQALEVDRVVAGDGARWCERRLRRDDYGRTRRLEQRDTYAGYVGPVGAASGATVGQLLRAMGARLVAVAVDVCDGAQGALGEGGAGAPREVAIDGE